MRVHPGLWFCLLVACGESTGTPLDGAGPSGDGSDGGATQTPQFEAGAGPVTSFDAGYTPGAGTVGCEKMDILFVIDNSASMGEEQENLVANFPRFIEVLDGFRGGDLQYRLGVTTTSFDDFSLFGNVAGGSRGELLRTGDMPDPWLDRGAPDLAATFTELATVGVNGSANEQPLRAAKYALTDRVQDGTNAGFLRPDALLALVFLTDEDDHSSTEGGGGGLLGELFAPDAPVMDSVDAYDGIAMGRERWAAAVIAGDMEPKCSSAFGDANYADRLIEFVQLAGSQATFGSICEGDLSGQLDAALNTFSAACETFIPPLI